MKDKIGFEIPSHLVETWKEADKIGRELCRDIQTIYQKIEKKLTERDPIFAEVTQGTVEDLKHVWRCLQQVIPWAICPYDQGAEIERDGCRACYGKGYLSKFRWDRVVPKDKKARAHRVDQNRWLSNELTGPHGAGFCFTLRRVVARLLVHCPGHVCVM